MDKENLKDKVKERIEQFKILADDLIKNNKSVFIKSLNGDIFFGDIILNGEETLLIECFSPQQRKGQKFTIYWSNVEHLDVYKERA